MKGLKALISRRTQTDVFRVWRYDHFLKLMIMAQWVFIALLMAVIYMLYSGWKTAPVYQRFYVAPALVAKGGYVKANQPSKANIFGFAYNMYLSINTFPDSVKADYPKNLKSYQYYLSSGYRTQVTQDMRQKTSDVINNNMSVSYQLLNPMFSEDFVNTHVKEVRTGIWHVTFFLKENQSLNDKVIASNRYEITLQVSLVAPNVTYNPFGLQLDGVVSQRVLTQEQVDVLLKS